MKPSLRTDAARNRERIIAAARELLTSGEISMDAVARKAGLGRATLYRNFEDLDALSSSIFEQNVRSLEAKADAEQTSPGAFERLLLATIDEGLACRGLIPSLATRGASPEVARLSRRVNAVLGRALAAARRRREVRADLRQRDVVELVAMVFSTVLTAPGSPRPRQRARRALALLLDGVRPR